jgi:hypothetical protein
MRWQMEKPSGPYNYIKGQNLLQLVMNPQNYYIYHNRMFTLGSDACDVVQHVSREQFIPPFWSLLLPV